MEGGGSGSEEELRVCHLGGVEGVCQGPGSSLSYDLACGSREDGSRGMAAGSQDTG